MRNYLSLKSLTVKKVLPIVALLLVFIISRILLIVNAPFIFHIDSYAYMNQVMDLFSNGAMNVYVGLPFVAYLAAFYYVFGSFLGVILASRIAVIFVSALIVCLLYLLASKIGGRTFGFITALCVIFEPLFITYSIVPHNDVFAIAMLLLSLYLLSTDKGVLRYLSPCFFYIAVFTRVEYAVIVIPIEFFLMLNLFKNPLKQWITRFAIPMLLYALPIVMLFNYAQTFTRFTVLEKFFLFLTPGQLQKTFSLSLAISNNPLVDLIIFITIFGTVFFAIGRLVYSMLQTKKPVVKQSSANLALLLFLVFVFYILAITAYGYGYTVVDGNLRIYSWLTERYLIFPQLLFSFLLAYPLSLTVQKLYSLLKTDFRSQLTNIMSETEHSLNKIARMPQVRRRRSDRGFSDFQRYVEDLNYIKKSLSNCNEILDVGAGAGVFSIALSVLGKNVTALGEATSDNEHQFFNSYGCRFATSNLDEQGLPFVENTFDMAICLHVIEHLARPVFTLKEIKRVLKPNGILILMTPNGAITSFSSNIPTFRQGNSDHIKEYSVKELKIMLNKNKFKITDISYSNQMVICGTFNQAYIKRVLLTGYGLLSSLFPSISYEVHVTARNYK